MPVCRMKLPLFDDYWIDFRKNTVRRWFAPERYALLPAGPYCSMVYGRELKKYRVYYETLMNIGNDGPRQLRMLEGDDLREMQPCLVNGDPVLFRGEGGVHGTAVMLDTYTADPNKRYKLTGMFHMGRDVPGNAFTDPVALLCSAGGVHWSFENEKLLHPYTSDALNRLYYNPFSEEYMLLHRAAFVDRRISLRTSKDTEHWSEPQVILPPGPNYNNGFTGMQHYSMTARYEDGIFYGLVWRYNTNLYDMEFTRMFGYMEPELVYSYDGREYMYTSGKALMERPMPPEPGCVGLAPQDMCQSADGQYYYILCSGAVFVHGTAESNKLLHDALKNTDVKGGNPVYRIRKDSFCGIESVGHGGEVVTKGIALLKDDLSVNVRANVGYVRFALRNKDGSFVEGFSYDDCIPYAYKDGVDVRPVWKEHSLNEVLGRQVRICVELNSAILHCITATARPYIRQPQMSMANPMAAEV